MEYQSVDIFVAFAATVIVAWMDGNLFKVATASCVAVYLTELIV